jgi:two-component system response regulator YesN
MGFGVSLAENDLEGLAVLIAGFFDLVLTDLQVPLMDGSRLAHFIKQMSPDSKVILLTGSDSEGLRLADKVGSFDRVIFKQPNLEDFRTIIQEALGSRLGDQGIMRDL